ncbi:hypothetical protein EJP80_03165 [Rahnella aquatilis]|nr:hypothetical protein EJP80_03165 [Rahnella aquatilis]
MAKQYAAIITTKGQTLIAAALQGSTTVLITEMAVGDGNGSTPVPNVGQTKLVNETARIKINSLTVDAANANHVIADGTIPAETGGFWLREVGLFTEDGALLAVSALPPTYKPSASEGATNTQRIIVTLIVSDTSAVNITVDNTTVMASEAYVDDLLAAHEKSRNHPDGTLTEKGFVQLSSSTASTSETLAATPKAVKAANDNANGRLPSGGTAAAATKLATAHKIAGHAFDGTADISISPGDVGALPSGGTAAAATKLATARKIAGHAFDGTADISISAGDVGALPSGGTAAAATKLATARKIAGHAFDGTADISISAGDVGALPSSGTAAAATKLATARKIAGHAFDGTADISISAGDVGALPSGGTAAAATKLATARKIAGHAFDGTADISISASDVGLDKVGNFAAVQQGGGTGMATNKIYIGWTGSKVKIQVDASDMGEVYTTANPPPITTQAITAVRLGASYKHASTNNSSGSVQLVNGEVVTGAVGSGGSDFNKAEWFVRPIQYFINGSWITATSA